MNLSLFFLNYLFRIKLVVSEDDVRKSYQRAMDSMARLNRTAARLMHKYNAHGSTDITGSISFFYALTHTYCFIFHLRNNASFGERLVRHCSHHFK